MKTEPLLEQLKQARPLLEPQWTPERAEAVRRKMAVTRRKRQVRRAGLSVLALLVAVGMGALLWRSPSDAPLADVTVVAVSPETRWIRSSAEPGLESVALEQGGAWFNVERNPLRVFRVSAGPVDVDVLGTRFLVERKDKQVYVAVDHGRVRVRWPQGSRELTAGQSAWFPPAPEPPPPPQPTAPAPELKPQPPPVAPPAPVQPSARPTVRPQPPLPEPPKAQPQPPEPPKSWQQLAQEGDFDGAWEALESDRMSLRDDPAELLLVADVARLSRHAEMALPPLNQVIERHPGDPRAPLAAFTLGRVLLEELGWPREAAAAFAQARALSPTAPLAEDALAREVEAHSRAGDTARARTLAEEFVRLYPSGQRLRAVRHFGGLE
ncbi:MAG TPA: FecR domain-containing protein [Hyalangium sp.]|nr:FecR domain-containing protein [Hyalangium sp.]